MSALTAAFSARYAFNRKIALHVQSSLWWTYTRYQQRLLFLSRRSRERRCSFMRWSCPSVSLFVCPSVCPSSVCLSPKSVHNKCIEDSMKATARRSPNCIRKTKNKIRRKTIFNMVDGILSPCNVARGSGMTWHLIRQVTAPAMWQEAVGWHSTQLSQTSAILEFHFRFRFRPYMVRVPVFERRCKMWRRLSWTVTAHHAWQRQSANNNGGRTSTSNMGGP